MLAILINRWLRKDTYAYYENEEEINKGACRYKYKLLIDEFKSSEGAYSRSVVCNKGN